MPKRLRLLERDALVMMSPLRVVAKACDAAVSGSSGQLREVSAFEARVRMLCDELDSIKRRDSKNCNPEVFTREVADDKANIFGLATRLYRSAVRSYNSIYRKVGGDIFDVRERLKEAFDCKALSLQQSVSDAVCAAAESV